MCAELSTRYTATNDIKTKDEFIDMLSTCTEDELTLLSFKSGSLVQYMQENLEEYRKTKLVRTIKYDPLNNDLRPSYVPLAEYLMETNRFRLFVSDENNNFQVLCIKNKNNKLSTFYLFFGDLYFTVTLSAQTDIGLEEFDIQWV